MAQAPRVEDMAPGRRPRSIGELALDGPQHRRAIVDRGAERAQPPQREGAGDEEAIDLGGDLRCQSESEAA